MKAPKVHMSMEVWNEHINEKTNKNNKREREREREGNIKFAFYNAWPKLQTYRSDPKYWDRQAWANCVDLDQTPQNAASDQGLHCLPLLQYILRCKRRHTHIADQQLH